MAMTAEQRKAASERMKALHQRKKIERDALLADAPKDKTTEQVVEPVKETIEVADYNKLKAEIEELKRTFYQSTQNVAQVQGGKLIGRTDKYITDPAYYPNPVERLMDEPKLARFAFKVNYELDFNINSTQYQTIDGLNMREPKFSLALHKIIMDEKTGEPTNKRFVVARLVLHEDPDAALLVARREGLDVDENDERRFLDEMRYLRMRDWLLGLFYQSAPDKRSKKRQEVIGGRLVEVFEISSSSADKIPFDELKGKV